MFRTVGKFHKVLPVIDASQFQDAASSHDSRAMYSEKLGRVELLFEEIHGFAQEVRAPMNVQFRVVSGCSNPFGIVCKHDLNARTCSHYKPRDIFFGLPSKHLQDALG